MAQHLLKPDHGRPDINRAAGRRMPQIVHGEAVSTRLATRVNGNTEPLRCAAGDTVSNDLAWEALTTRFGRDVGVEMAHRDADAA